MNAPIFNENDEPNDALKEIADGFESQARNFLVSLVHQGYTVTEIRAAGGYLTTSVDVAISVDSGTAFPNYGNLFRFYRS